MPGFRHAVIVATRMEGGRWTEPEVAPFSQDPRWRVLEPCVSPDGKRFFFVSDRPEDPAAVKAGASGIWVMERQGQAWGPPHRLPASVWGTGNLFYSLGHLEMGPLRHRFLLAERTLPGNGNTAVWWVDAGFLDELRRKSIGE